MAHDILRRLYRILTEHVSPHSSFVDNSLASRSGPLAAELSLEDGDPAFRAKLAGVKGADGTSAVDSRIAYVVAHCFLEKVFEVTHYEDLIILFSGMELTTDGTISMDPAMIHDWHRAVGGKTTFSRSEAFDATRSFLEQWYEIGPQDEIRNVIDMMTRGVDDESSDGSVRKMWASCWETVMENVRLGEPYKTAYAYGVNPKGEHGRMDQHPETGELFFRVD